MSQHARDYLIQRFTDDARALHERVASMRRGTKVPGPDALTSERMADACEDVVDLIESLDEDSEDGEDGGEGQRAMAEWPALLVPLLEQRMKEHQANAAVRAVYAGAIARVREVQEAERRDEPR